VRQPMRTIKKKQMLTTGIVDANGNQIDPNVIEWDLYDKNPVLMYDRKEEGHRGVAVGKVINRERVQNGWAGVLAFMERFEDADIAFEKYSQGVLPYVSVGGFAVGKETNGVFVAERYRIREVSLVRFPANIEASVINASELNEEETKLVNNLSTSGEVRYLTMSCNVTHENMQTPEELEAERKRVEAEEAERKRVEAEEAERKRVEAEEAERKRVEAEEAERKRIEAEEAERKRVEAEEVERKRVEAEEAERKRIEAEKNPLPPNMTWHQINNQQQSKTFEMKTFKELNCDADFQKRLQAMTAALGAGAPKTDAVPENAETLQILASAMLQDKDVVVLASVTNYTDAISQKRRNALGVLIEAAAGNATAATLAAADLGVITYLSLFYQKLLANDTFRRSIRLVPMSDRAGAIYIEDNVAAPTYVGNNTPINAPIYTYDDIKRTIARRVFAFNPILFQHSELAILAYDKQSNGLQSTMAQLMQDISTYWLQIIANTSGISKIRTTGSVVSSVGKFPIEAPNSDLSILKPTLEDIITLEGNFLMQNFNFGESGRYVECVLPSNMYSMLAGDPEVRSQLTRELNANIASAINFSATRITPRNPVARFNNTSGNFELDPAMYADKNVADNGTHSDIVPATTVAANVGAGIAFVAQEILAGVGSIELIVSPSPQNYGTIVSGWISTGCTVARSNGVGAAALIPGVEIGG
jgi:flagellar biosynthesis GTPase FlhF